MSDESILSYSEDVSTAEAPPPLPVGDYPAEIFGAEAKVSQNSGNKYLDLTLRISPDDYPADYPVDLNPDGVTLHWRRTVIEDSPRGRHNMRRLCESCGVVAAKSVNIMDFVGQSVRVSIKHDEYNGVQREDITEIQAA